MCSIFFQRIFFVISIVLAIFCILTLSPDTGIAGDSVSGQYVAVSGTSIALILTINSPAPAGLIVEQYSSPANTIVSTSPQAKKVNVDNGVVKWLFRKTPPGTYTLTTQLAHPLRGNFSATIRYRAPGSGQLIEKTITP